MSKSIVKSLLKEKESIERKISAINEVLRIYENRDTVVKEEYLTASQLRGILYSIDGEFTSKEVRSILKEKGSIKHYTLLNTVLLNCVKKGKLKIVNPTEKRHIYVKTE